MESAADLRVVLHGEAKESEGTQTKHPTAKNKINIRQVVRLCFEQLIGFFSYFWFSRDEVKKIVSSFHTRF